MEGFENFMASCLETTEKARRTLEKVRQQITSTSDQLQRLERDKNKAIEEHRKLRVQLVLNEMARRHLTWCTKCNEVVKDSQVKLVFTEGVKVRSGGYEGGDWGCVPFAQLYRACSKCHQQLIDRHGELGRRDPMNGLQEHFYAFEVKEEASGLQARKFGEMVKLEKKFKLPEKPWDSLLDRLAIEWKIPDAVKI